MKISRIVKYSCYAAIAFSIVMMGKDIHHYLDDGFKNLNAQSYVIMQSFVVFTMDLYLTVITIATITLFVMELLRRRFI